MEGDLITQLAHTCQSDGTGFDPKRAFKAGLLDGREGEKAVIHATSRKPNGHWLAVRSTGIGARFTDYRFETSLKRLKCANTGRSPTARRTGQVDPKRTSKIALVNGR